MKSIMRRELNIECLRCVAMLFIVLNHCILNIATKQLTLDISPINFCITNFIYQVVYNGVNIFVLISGYFLVDTTRQSTNWEKVMKLWLNVFFYSVVIYILCVVFHYRTFELKELLHVLMPIKYDSYWFITQYIGLYILSPFLAKWAQSMSRQEYKTLLISFFVITSILQLKGLRGVFSLIWFLFLFLFAGYIRRWGGTSVTLNKWEKHPGAIFLATSTLLFLLSFLYNGNKLNIVGYWGFYNGPLLFIASVSLFLYFKKMAVSKIIILVSKLSSYMFGVYLIHEHPVLKVFFWDSLNKRIEDVNILSLLSIAIIIIILCTLVEFVRSFVFKVLKIDSYFYKCIKFLFLSVIAQINKAKCLILH